MTFQTLTPTQFVADGAGLDITANLAAPTNVNLQFQNTGHEQLFVAPTATSETVTVDIGVTVLGQTVANFTAVAMTTGHIYAFGPFHSAIDQPGGSAAQITLSTTTAITVGLFQTVGVF